MSRSERFTTVAIVLHWLIAAAVIGDLALGWWMQEIPKQPPGPRASAYNLHKSLGLLALAFVAARIAWRLRHPSPPLPPMPRWQAWLANAVHHALDALLVVLVIAGYLGSVYSGYPIKFFGLTLPSWGRADPGLKDFMSVAHFWSSWLLAALLAFHVAGVVKHAVIDRDGLLRRMGWGQ
jgi:cytochrome b561